MTRKMTSTAGLDGRCFAEWLGVEHGYGYQRINYDIFKKPISVSYE
jgi:hypothetical protein